MSMDKRFIGAVLAIRLVGGPAFGAEPAPLRVTDPLATSDKDVIATIGLGARLQPSFDGASTMLLSPMPIVKLKFLRSPFTGNPTSDTGFGIFPSFRFLNSRSGTGKLQGLNPIKQAVELGAGFDYTDTYWRAFVEIRQGFGGHHGQTADIGFDGIFRPIERLKLEAGPRLSLASAGYMRTYFGVTPAESLASGGKFAMFRPAGGIRGLGLGGTAIYDLSDNWQVRADAGWTRLVGDAAKSPIVTIAGNKNQFTLGLGVAYRFGIGWH